MICSTGTFIWRPMYVRTYLSPARRTGWLGPYDTGPRYQSYVSIREEYTISHGGRVALATSCIAFTYLHDRTFVLISIFSPYFHNTKPRRKIPRSLGPCTTQCASDSFGHVDTPSREETQPSLTDVTSAAPADQFSSQSHQRPPGAAL